MYASGGFGSRRPRRNNFFSNQPINDDEEAFGIDWGSNKRVESHLRIEEAEEEEVIVESNNEEEQLCIDGIPIRVGQVSSKSNKVKQVRYTTYLDENVLNVLKILKKTDQISISNVINEAIKEYLKENYGDIK